MNTSITNPTVRVLVLYHSRHGSVAELAQSIATGILAAGGEPVLRQVPPLAQQTPSTLRHPLADLQELRLADAIAMGSPVRFGQMAAEMKHFWEQTSSLWIEGTLINKPAGVFTASSSLHGGQEANLLGMMLPLLHHGMVLVGQPYDEPALHQTQTGGTPYGPSHVSGMQGSTQLSAHEHQLAISFGKRLTAIARKLK